MYNFQLRSKRVGHGLLKNPCLHHTPQINRVRRCTTLPQAVRPIEGRNPGSNSEEKRGLSLGRVREGNGVSEFEATNFRIFVTAFFLDRHRNHPPIRSCAGSYMEPALSEPTALDHPCLPLYGARVKRTTFPGFPWGPSSIAIAQLSLLTIQRAEE